MSSNKLKKISGLELAVSLDKLWLDCNQIESLEGLQNLVNLSELNLAMNQIEMLGIHLDNLKGVRELNLAGNQIGSFKEVLNLTRLPNLQYCNFSDPNYGENPICSLCNYQTYVLFHLQTLVRLDMQMIGDDSKAFAESTFMKKRMYYNMRIKTIQRNTSNIMKILKICKKLRISKLDHQQSKLQKKLQELQREIEERQHISREFKSEFNQICTFGPNNLTSNPLDDIEDETFQNDIEQKKGVIMGRIHERQQDLKQLESGFKEIKNQIYQMAQQNIGRLMTELDTGGNIRFEEGRPQDKWYTSCVDLVRSRFNAEQMKFHGVLGITVTRVTRIHNRFLRNRFEEKLEQLVDLSDNQYKRSLEYLFYGVNPQAPQEIHKAMENGFRSYQEYEEAGLPGCVSLVNSVASAETPRIHEYLNRKKNKKEKKRESKAPTDNMQCLPIPSGQILVCKIFLQKCVHDNKTPFFDNTLSPTEIWKQSPVNPAPFQKVQSVYRVKESDPKQRMWYVIDNALALPEYLVDFDYNMNQSDIAESKRLSELSVLNEECNNLFTGVTEAQRVLESTSPPQHDLKDRESGRLQPKVHLTTQDLDRSDMNYVKKPLHGFMIKCHVKELMDNNYEFLENKKIVSIEDSMPPEILLRSQFNAINENLIVNISRQKDLTKIVYLNLFNNCIRSIEALDGLINLEVLILSSNQIQEIKGLTQNRNLKRLELNHNFIRLIEDSLSQQSNLISLNLQDNWINEVSQIQNVQSSCPKLKEISLKGNPISNNKQYRANIFAIVPMIELLDGLKLQLSDSDVSQRELELSIEMIQQSVKQSKRLQVQISNKNELKKGWETTVEELNLCHLKITKIVNLDQFQGLRKLSLLDNKISHISGLEKLVFLEELSLEKNKLTLIQNIENLKYLKKLDLGSNKIKRIQNLNNLTSLAQLSLENNEIQRLDGVQDLHYLMELYLGNNYISDIREIVKLKDLPRLIILDVSCNPCSNTNNTQNNRVYCIFHLRKLRVLDGQSIDPQEHLEAKETFSGRLTEEIMNSRLQGRKLNDMRELDLSNCKLRDFEDMFDCNKMPSIRELNLTNNMLSSLRCLGFLPTLKILKLRQNKIETLFCKPGPDDKNFKKGLFGMPSLEVLDVSSNLLQYLYGLQFSPLKDLKILMAADNQIVKIEHLEKLKSLRELDLSKNKIRQIDHSSFIQPSHLTLLKLEENAIKSLALLENLGKLQSLLMAGNRIGEFFELERVADLPDLVELSLVQNPIQRKPNYRFVVIKRMPQLIIFDGKEIPQDERKRVELAGGGQTNPTNQQAPLIHFAVFPNNQGKVPVKVNNVNFEAVFDKRQDVQQSSHAPISVQQRQYPQNEFLQNQFGLERMGNQHYSDQNRIVPMQEIVSPIQESAIVSRANKRPATYKNQLQSEQQRSVQQNLRSLPESIQQSQNISQFATNNRDRQILPQQQSQSYIVNYPTTQSTIQSTNPLSNSAQSQIKSRQSTQFNQKGQSSYQGISSQLATSNTAQTASQQLNAPLALNIQITSIQSQQPLPKPNLLLPRR